MHVHVDLPGMHTEELGTMLLRTVTDRASLTHIIPVLFFVVISRPCVPFYACLYSTFGVYKCVVLFGLIGLTVVDIL